jgi:tetratricopeptide (TPR) repeat protein
VPYIVTNDGDQSRKAVELYVTSLRSAERQRREADVNYVLELGSGTGLFAKSFLDQLAARSRSEGTRDYAATTYILADHSRGLLDDTEQSGVLAEHANRVVRVLLPPGGLTAALRAAVPQAVGALRAVHANYLLDSLPFTILSCTDHGLFELRVRTRSSDGVISADGSAPPAGDSRAIEAWLAAVAPFESSTAAETGGALLFECEYVPVTRESMPLPQLLPEYDATSESRGSQQFVHSYGAAQCLEEVLSLLASDGYFVGVDYSCDGVRTEPVEFQSFGPSIAAPVNFAQLVALARSHRDCVVGVPSEDPASLQARLFARGQAPPELIERFRALYHKEESEPADAVYREALNLAQVGRFEAARWKFDEAHRLQPYNWPLLESMVAFLSHTLEEHAAGLEVGQRALELNHLSPRLWNLLGDCHYGLDALGSAEAAYRQAIQVNPVDVRARGNLAYVFLKRGAHGEALRVIGEALALDHAGEFRDELLGKQGEALRGISAANVSAARSNLNRLSGHFALPGRSPIT